MNTKTPVQLSLNVSLRDDATFANFYAQGEANAQALFALRSVLDGQSYDNVLIWGARGAGLSHLLQGVCHQADERGLAVQYFPLADVRGYTAADLCEGLEAMDIVCLDGLEHICGNSDWEQAIFHLYNRMRDAGKPLLLSSHTSPPSLPILLPDLKSRVLGCVVYHVESLGDDGKKMAMIARAAARGMEMPADVATYILSRASRDTAELFTLLNRLDDASLQEQRKLTIPFVKSVLGREH
ncbi:DnaA regulatory inactivator Hda [Teredinibacter waterburyi]|uniref:DnaA regulatory inactivator Hda n=1 Tax=Teredinibacter waterburyi TaxID=1500538 RepID=UPI00165FC529|nr:DnaA regulatory inactivator Hda [Teredinibacter waterburyi]